MRSSTRKTLGDWRIRRGVTIAPTKSAIGAIAVRGWSNSAGSDANQCRRVVDGTDIWTPIDPDETYRLQFPRVALQAFYSVRSERQLMEDPPSGRTCQVK
jgi:hypothetical protein